MKYCGIVLLAAGKSDRLGSPKQILIHEGKTLLQHSVEEALGTGIRPVVVVLGASHVLFEESLRNFSDIEIVINEAWEEGMASSIRAGVQTAMKLVPGLDGLIMMVCDQPFVSRELLEELVHTQQETGMPVVASSYGNNQGVPVLFHKDFFSSLLELRGDTGARKILKDQAAQLALVNFPEGVKDIDTMNDYEELIREARND